MKAKKLISLVLVLLLAGSLMAVPASAANEEPNQKDYPFVLVHGLLGWGDRSKLSQVLPYFGLTSGSIAGYIKAEGYECYAAQVGPITSAWDRACEMYAQLTGTTVDYGIAHSAEKAHDRFGITYEAPLFDGWGADKKINLIGHSFGGATSRMLTYLLEYGCPEEVEAAKAAGVPVSPLFEGGKGDWVYSVTCVSAPHNGTSFHQACPMSTELLIGLAYDFATTLDMLNVKGVYDLQLEHFGLSRRANETDMEFLCRAANDDKFLSHNDNALYDLTIDSALKINDSISMIEGVYYFSIAGDCTKYNALTGTYGPDENTCLLLKPFAAQLGGYYDRYTPGGVYIDKTYLKNDGLVNLCSGLYPKNSQLEAEPFTMYDGSSAKSFEPGVWNVLPTMPYDHISAIGGLLSNTSKNVRSLYTELVDNVTSTYEEPVDPGFSFTSICQKIMRILRLTSIRDFLYQLFSMVIH